jgi:hypothetical protein
MGAVFKATHVMLGKPVAVKLIKADLVTSPDMVRRFQREARAATSLNHPNIVGVHDLGQTEDGTLYIAMELVDGISLKDVIRESGRIDAPRIVSTLRQVGSALSLAHRHQIIHRDLKPQNVMLTRDAEGREIAKLLDFGIAKTFDEKATQLTRTGLALGTPQYMSPEQAMGKEVDGRSDLYSLGVMLYEMLIGEVPFTAPSATAILVKHMTEVPAPPSRKRPDLQVPAHLEAIALKCLEKDPSRRYQTADEFIAALESGPGTETTIPLAAPAAPLAAAVLMPPPGATASIPTAAAGFAPALPATATHVPTAVPSPAVAAPPPSAAAPAQTADTRPTVPAVQAVVAPPAHTGSKAGLAIAAGLMFLLLAAGGGAYYMTSRFSATPPEPGAGPAPDTSPTTALPPVQPNAPAAVLPVDPQKVTPQVEAGAAAAGAAAVRTPPPAKTTAAPTPPTASDPAAPPIAASPTLPEQPSVFVDCQGTADLCGAVRSAFDQQIESNGLGIARSKDIADILIVATIGVTAETRDEMFTTRSYVLDVVGDAPKLDKAVGMPAARSFSFDARVGRERLNENARAMAVQSINRVKDFIEKNR